MRELIKEAVLYAKSNRGFDKILSEILQKYKTLGRFTGSIQLNDLNDEENRILGAIDYKLYGKKEAKLSISKFLDYFLRGRFKELSFECFMKEYFEEELKTNKEQQAEKVQKQQRYFDRILEEEASMTKGMEWLTETLREKTTGYSTIIKEYISDSKALKKTLHYVIKGLEELRINKETLEPLPIFSSRITKDPHYFDIGTTAFRLLLYGICYLTKQSYPQNIEEINEALYGVGIARDELSIFTTVFGIRAMKDIEEHTGWKGFNDEREPMHVSIKNLNSIDRLILSSNKAFIFENPVVFMEVIRRLNHANLRCMPALICTSGQLNTASLLLLDKLYKDRISFYYSGDFDPEGLRIADKLKNRYKDNLILWRYSIEDYLKVKGDKSFEQRINKFDRIQNEELSVLVEEMHKHKMSGYQELLIEEYVDDIVKMSIRVD
ncbi:MAG: hypothetical protein A2Y23_08520 [Clostridiales bacterium GWB2_37_7]|nr:MAG: hypothetical protein A2Y23_08520 [Clostridiales bacterium GWB2_37_7]